MKTVFQIQFQNNTKGEQRVLLKHDNIKINILMNLTYINANLCTQGHETKNGSLEKTYYWWQIWILHKSLSPLEQFSLIGSLGTSRGLVDHVSRATHSYTDRAKLDPVRMQRSLSTNTSRQCSLQEHMSTSFIRCGQGLNYVWSQNEKKKGKIGSHAAGG